MPVKTWTKFVHLTQMSRPRVTHNKEMSFKGTWYKWTKSVNVLTEIYQLEVNNFGPPSWLKKEIKTNSTFSPMVIVPIKVK